MADDIVIPVRADTDVLVARQQVRALVAPLTLSSGEMTLIATAISELARNIIIYAKSGEIVLRLVQRGRKRGITVVARDQGPGIPNIDLAMQDGYSTSRGLGLGLPGSKRLMDEFHIVSVVGEGTTVTMTKWEQ